MGTAIKVDGDNYFGERPPHIKPYPHRGRYILNPPLKSQGGKREISDVSIVMADNNVFIVDNDSAICNSYNNPSICWVLTHLGYRIVDNSRRACISLTTVRAVCGTRQ